MTIWEVLWTMLMFYFLFMVIWMFIGIFADIFRRDDLSGWAKAGWLILIFVLPLLGILIYMIVRPKMTEQDKRMMAEAQERERRAAGYSATEEIAKAAELKDKGAISAEEFEDIKRRALA